MQTPLLVLAAVDTGKVLLWVALLIVVVIGGGVVILIVRRRVLGPGESGRDDVGLMEGLRRAKQAGELSEEEFDQVRRRMAMRLRDAGSGSKSPARGGDGVGSG